MTLNGALNTVHIICALYCTVKQISGNVQECSIVLGKFANKFSIYV